MEIIEKFLSSNLEGIEKVVSLHPLTERGTATKGDLKKKSIENLVEQ